MILADFGTENPVLNSAMALLEVMISLNEGLRLPKLGQADYKLVGKLISFRTGIPLDKEVQEFDPAEYVKNLSKTLRSMLQKGIQDFLKDVPKQTSIPQWLSSLKEALKDPKRSNTLNATRPVVPATCDWPLEDVLAVEEKLNAIVFDGSQIADTAFLLALIPQRVADHYRIPPATFTVETDLACIEIRETIGAAIEHVRAAWRNWQERDGSALAAPSANEAVGTDVESEYALPAEGSDATHADTGAADSEARATDAERANLLSVGDVVITAATKHKDQWDKRKACIVGVLKSHYKVQMLEGPSQGVMHKYAFKDCSLVPAATGAASIAASSAASIAASSTDSGVASVVAATSAVAATIDETGAATMPPSQQQARAVPNWDDYDFESSPTYRGCEG